MHAQAGSGVHLDDAAVEAAVGAVADGGGEPAEATVGGEAVSEEVLADAVELPEEEMTALMNEGAQVFTSNCAVCHGAEGRGGIGPGFVGNSQVSNTTYVVNRILDGFIDHGMPPFAGVLSDRQIAAVSTHIRNSWGNEFGPVLEEEVAQER